MFEFINDDDDGIGLNAPTICFVLGWLPFIIAWAEYNTVLTEWLVQVYFLTILIFIVYPTKYARKNVRQRWFWKAMLAVALVLHPVILVGMWFVDAWEKTKWHEATTMLSTALAALIVEALLLYKIVAFLSPVGETPPNAPVPESDD
jgi:cyanate permease